MTMFDTPPLPATSKARRFLGADDMCEPAQDNNTRLTRLATLTINTTGDAMHFTHSITPAAQVGTLEEESDTIPKPRHFLYAKPQRSAQYETTDASSLRRQTSDSTIISFYDPQSVPLCKSQQTANSAIAKGLPSKAAELLDIRSPSSNKPHRPSRLDLGRLLHFPRSPKSPTSSSSTPPFRVTDGALHSPEFSYKSSSDASEVLQGETARSGHKSIRKKLTFESLRSHAAQHAIDHNNRVSKSAAGADLLLYDHYQRMIDRDVSEDCHGTGYAGQSQGVSKSTTRRPALPHGRTTPPDQSTFAPATQSRLTHHSASRVSETPSSVTRPPTCNSAMSVSSTFTRTSQASKRTDRSFVDFSPHSNSVLSLTDSEDEDSEHFESPPGKLSQSSPTVNHFSNVQQHNPAKVSSMTEQHHHRDLCDHDAGVSVTSKFLRVPSEGSTMLQIRPRTSSVAKTKTPLGATQRPPQPYYRSLATALATRDSHQEHQNKHIRQAKQSREHLSTSTESWATISSSQAEQLLTNRSPEHEPRFPQLPDTARFDPAEMPRLAADEFNALHINSTPHTSNNEEDRRRMTLSDSERLLIERLRIKRKLMCADPSNSEVDRQQECTITSSRSQLHSRTGGGTPFINSMRTYDNYAPSTLSPTDLYARPPSSRSAATDGTNVHVYLDHSGQPMSELVVAEPMPAFHTRHGVVEACYQASGCCT